MKNQKTRLTAVVLMMAPSLLFAQEQTQTQTSEVQLSLKEAVENALQYSKTLQASKMDYDLYKQKIRETRATNLPQASASLGYTTYFGKSLEMAGMEIEMEDAITLTASASYTLSFQALASVKLQKLAADIADVDYLNDELSVKANVIDTYYAVLVYKRNLEILKQNLADMEDIQYHTENMYEVGTVEKTDVDQITINVLTLRNSIMSTERSCEVYKRLLVLQMGLPIETRIDPNMQLEDLIEDRTVAALDSSRFDITTNLEYRTLELSNEVNEQTVKMRRRAYIPTLSLAYNYSNPLKGGFMNFDHTGTATLTVPLFKGFERDAQLKQAKIEVQRGETNMALLVDNLTQNDEQYRYELNTAIDAYLLQKENLDVARRVLENYKNKYNQGALSSLDLTQANTNYLSAETSYASACLDLLTAHTTLSKLYNNFEY